MASASRSFKPAFILTLAGNFFLQGFYIATGMLAARLLGPERRGELAAVFFYPVLISYVGCLGIQQAMAFAVSQRPQDTNVHFRAGFWLSVLLALPQIAVCVLMIPYVLASDKTHLLATIQWFLILLLPMYVELAMMGGDQGAFNFKRYNLLRVLPNILYAVGALLLWLMDRATVQSFALAYFLAQFLVLLLRIGILGRIILALPTWGEIKALLRQGLDFQMPQIAGILLDRADMWMAVALLPSKQIGLYVVAQAVAWGQYGVSSAYTQVGFAKISGEMDRSVARSSFLAQFRSAKLVLCVVAAVFVIFTPYIIQFAFGTAFIDATKATYWLVGSMTFVGLNKIVDTGLRTLGHSWAGALAYAVGLSILCPIGWFLVPEGGIELLAKITLIANGVTFVSLCILFCYLEHIGIGAILGLSRESILRPFEQLD
jgi:O-antigen/teichoic acid export membrane protein